jgi:lysyl-tRNA synthetase class 2
MAAERARLAAKRPFLELRARVLQAIRTFFAADGFLEVQTPVRTPAPAPEPHIDAVASDGWFLATSPELYLKRLLAAGYERLFELARVFRAAELGRWHHPEFTLLEWYRLGADYRVLQEDCRRLLTSVCEALAKTRTFPFRGHVLTVAGTWPVVTVREAFLRHAGWDPVGTADAERFLVDLVEKVEPQLGFPTPCFVTDYPASEAALARLSPLDGRIAERFELYWGALELANGFSELTDPGEQRARFEAACAARSQAGRPVTPIPEAFLESLSHLPPCAGIALGVDRLVAILANAGTLDDVVAFPPDLA